MARALIGRTVRRLRSERRLTQQALAVRLGISASYLNLIEHDQRAVTASLLIKLGETLGVDLATLSGRGRSASSRSACARPSPIRCCPPMRCRRRKSPSLPPRAECGARGAGAVSRLARGARGRRRHRAAIGRRVLLPNEEARDLFDDRGNHFPPLEAAAEAIAAELRAAPAEMNHAIAERLRRMHGLTVTVQPLEGALRRYDPATRALALSEMLPRESRGFHMAFQLALLEARDAVEAMLADAAPSSPEAGHADPRRAAQLRRRGAADAVCRVRRRGARAATRHGGAGGALRRVVRAGVPPAVDVAAAGRARGAVLLRARRSGGQRVEALLRRGVSVRALWRIVSALGGAHGVLPAGVVQVQVAELPDGTAYLCFARTVTRPARAWGDPRPTHVVAMGCGLAHAEAVAYADGLDLERAKVGIGLSCRLCDRPDCRSRAFPPLEHRLALDPQLRRAPYRFETREEALDRYVRWRTPLLHRARCAVPERSRARRPRTPCVASTYSRAGRDAGLKAADIA